MRPQALIDTNIIVAILATDHEHHADSIGLIERARDGTFAVAAHSLCETYTTLTQPKGEYRFRPEQAYALIRSFVKIVKMIDISANETLNALGVFAGRKGVGGRVYDHMIGSAAIANGISVIITWDLSDFRSLFPQLTIVPPRDWNPA